MTSSKYQYIQMARISVVTICYTVFLAYLFLICKGWQITVQQLDRNQATNLTMIMGATYLLYSAYFLSTDFTSIFNIMSVVIALLYLGVGYTYTVNNFKNYKRVRGCLVMFAQNNEQENIMAPSLVIKAQMIRYIMIGSLGFCITNFFDYAIINLLGDHWFREKARLTIQSFDFVTLGLMLYVCRPRKEWPAFFSLTINEFNAGPIGNQANGAPRSAPPPAMVSYITSKLLVDGEEDDSRAGEIGAEEAVVFVNPTKYSLNVDDDECDAFEPDGIIEEKKNNDKENEIEKL